ncbi:TolC family protein [Thermocrinis sp.]|uniref:TolC family protein n=1 Tax=Thermocrinis sp. TaxID=2024383 RepID=UPI002FDEFDDA
MIRLLSFCLILLAASWGQTLEYVLQRAIEKNPEIEALRQEILSARASLKSQRQSYLPEFFVNYKITYNSQKQSLDMPVFAGLSFESSKQSYSLFQGGLRYLLFDGGARASLVESSTSELRIKNFLYEEKLKALELEVISAYLDVLSAKAIVEVIKKQKEAVELQLSTAEAFYQKGLVAITDLLQTKVRLAEVERDLRKAEGNYNLALSNLSRLSGIPEEELRELQEPEVDLDIKPLEHYMRFVERRNILEAQRERLKIFKAQRKLAKSEFFPKIFLETSYTYTDQNPALRPKGIFSVSAGLNLSFQGIKPYYQELSASYLELKAYNDYQDLLQKVKLDVKRAYEDLLISKDNLKVSEEALTFAEKFFELSREQYLNQLISQRELLEAEASLTKARVDRIISYYQLIRSYYTLMFVSGARK